MARPKHTHTRTEITVCCPANQSAASCIGQESGAEFRIVTLAMYGSGFPSYERWSSFGWHVLTGAQLAAYQADPSIEAVSNLKALLGTTASL